MADICLHPKQHDKDGQSDSIVFESVDNGAWFNFKRLIEARPAEKAPHSNNASVRPYRIESESTKKQLLIKLIWLEMFSIFRRNGKTNKQIRLNVVNKKKLWKKIEKSD